MRIAPLVIEVERWSLGNTLYVSLLEVDLFNENSLLFIGWYQGKFCLSIFYKNIIQ